MERTNSTHTFFFLLIVYVLVEGRNVFFPQDASGRAMNAAQLPVPAPVVASTFGRIFSGT